MFCVQAVNEMAGPIALVSHITEIVGDDFWQLFIKMNTFPRTNSIRRISSGEENQIPPSKCVSWCLHSDWNRFEANEISVRFSANSDRFNIYIE